MSNIKTTIRLLVDHATRILPVYFLWVRLIWFNYISLLIKNCSFLFLCMYECMFCMYKINIVTKLAPSLPMSNLVVARKEQIKAHVHKITHSENNGNNTQQSRLIIIVHQVNNQLKGKPPTSPLHH